MTLTEIITARFYIILLTFFLLVLPFSGFSQYSPVVSTDTTLFTVKNKTTINRQYFKSYLLDTKDVFTSPARWNQKEWLTFSGLVASVSFLMNYDDDIQLFVQDHRTPQTDRFSARYLEPWGSGLYSMSTMAVFYVAGSAFKDERMKRVALLGAKSYLVTGFMVLFPKHFFGRKRPNQGDDPYSWNGFGFKAKSFVSGHTTSVWSVATIVASEYRDKPIVPIISYSIATLSGYSRMNDHKHWFTDVLGGAFFGYAMGKLIYNQNNWKLNLAPYSTGDNFGIYMSYPIGEWEY